VPLYEFLCPDCGSRTEHLYVTSRQAERRLPCHCGSVQERIPSTFKADFGAERRRAMREQNVEIGTRDEITKHAAERRAESDARFDRRAAEVAATTLANWSTTNPGLAT
jgi:hypothetical protein